VLDRSKGGVTVTALHPRSDEPPLYDAALIAAVRDRDEGAVVCVDAPLTLPPCVPSAWPAAPVRRAAPTPKVVTLRRLLAPGPGESGVGRRGKPRSRLHPASD